MKKSLPIPLIAVFFANGLVYSLNALYYCFIQLYIEQYHTPVNVGILLSIGPFVAVAAPLFWGIRADKAKYKNTVLLITVCGSAVFFFALYINHSFWWLFFALTFLMFFMSPFGGLIDTITLEYAYKNNIPYGPPRLMGTLFFGLLSMVLSIFTGSNINIIFYVYVVTAALCGLCVAAMPKVEGHANKAGKINILPLFRYKKLMVMFVIIAIGQFAWGYYMNFFPTYMTGVLGLPQWVWGTNVFLTVLGEIPFFLMFNRIFDRIGIRKLLIFAIVLSVARYIALSAAAGMTPIFITALVTGVSLTVLNYFASVYINKYIAPAIQASGQTLMYALSVGIPKMLAGLAGGILTERIGVSSTMLICSALCVAAFAVICVFMRRGESGDN